MNRAVLQVVMASVVVGFGSRAFAEKCEPPPNSVTDFGTFVDFSRPISGNGSVEVRARADTRYLRVYLGVGPTAPSDWILRVYDLNGRPLQAISSTSVAGAEFWTERLPRSRVELVVDGTSSGPPIATMGYVEMPLNGRGQYYSLKQSGSPDWRDLYGGDVARPRLRLGESVGMLIGTYGSNADGHSTWTCSGTIISSQPTLLFLTAAHCGAPEEYQNLSWSDAITDRMIVDLSWDGDSISREYLVRKRPRIFTNADVALLTLVALDPGAPPPSVELRKSAPTPGESIFVIHHPASMQKQISSDCEIKAVSGTDSSSRFGHRCDTESGSSGAPIFDDNGKVVGIHLAGFEKKTDGTCDDVNKALSSTAIVSLIASNIVSTANSSLIVSAK